MHHFSARLCLTALAAIGALGTRPATSQIPVTDVAAIIQLVIQVEKLETQIETAKAHLQNAKDTYDSITGTRGMQDLLSGLLRNYLPQNVDELLDVLHNTSALYGQLASDYQNILQANAILPAAFVSHLSAAQRSLIDDQRQSAASLAAITHQSLIAASQRFGSIQGLIKTIATAKDQKAILDLQARVEAETTMMQNEAIKLQTLYQTTAAQTELRRQRLNELAIADVGSLRNLPKMGL